MSDNQKKEITKIVLTLLSSDLESSLMHEGCIGADIDFHNITDKCVREVYPGHFTGRPADKSHVGNFEGVDIVHESQTHFKRNRDIVDRCDILIAAPYNNIQKGGTWYTINYAKKVGKQTILIER